MKKYNEILQKYNIKPQKYQMIGKVTIIETEDGKYVLKPKLRDNSKNIYAYLDSRNFNYYPKIYSDDLDDYEITEYVNETELPKEQKIEDLIKLISLLHSKTTHYVETIEDDYKEIYEDILGNIEYLNSYYSDILEVIESHVYMSPSEYLFARNYFKIIDCLSFCKQEVDDWYNLIKTKKKKRLVVLHNNLDLSHFIKNKNSYLLNWQKAKIDIPIFDIYKLYKKYALDYDFNILLREYEKNYPLLEEEKKLLFILIALPERLEFDDDELSLCIKISKFIDYIHKTEMFLSPYYSKNEKQNT